ncbi:hypothetical protein AB0D33_40230 [Streptomyces sp. NPDC048404]|uniref:hypothetical protein n=1 Tax=unclassified Streptomyces TaxID=2593676 RepID=UPI003434A415
MRLRISIPLPGPFSIGGSIPLTSRRRSSPGAITALFKLFAYCLVAEMWIAWWCFKPFYMLGVLAHRKITGRNTVIWRSRGGWW